MATVRTRKSEFAVATETIGFLVWSAARSYSRHFAARIARHGITLGVWPVLRALAETPGLTQRDLSLQTGMKGPTIVDLVVQLEEKKLVRRVRNTEDRRKASLFLTERGQSVFAAALPDIAAVHKLAVAGMSRRDQDLLRTLLQRVHTTIRGA